MIMISFLISILFADSWRLHTDHVVAPDLHCSIRTKDIVTIPWQETKINENDSISPLAEEMALLFTGGIDYYGISLPGGADSPVVVLPSAYLDIEGNQYQANVFLDFVMFKNLPLYIQDQLIEFIETGELSHRINFEETPFFYGNIGTPLMDFPSTISKRRLIKLQAKSPDEYLKKVDRILHIQKKEADSHKRDIYVVPSLRRQQDEEEEQ
jgi:hypothetical protein